MHLFLFTNSAQRGVGFYMYAEYTKLQLTFLTLQPWYILYIICEHLNELYSVHIELLYRLKGTDKKSFRDEYSGSIFLWKNCAVNFFFKMSYQALCIIKGVDSLKNQARNVPKLIFIRC